MNMPLNIDFQQIFLHLLNFTVLFAILYFLLYSPVKKFMDERTEYYKKLKGDAEENLAKTEEMKEQYQSKLASAEQEASAMKAQAAKDIEAANSAKLKQAEKEARKIMEDARSDAEKERSKILRETQKEIVEMASAAAEKVILNATTSDAYDSFLSIVKRSGADE